MESNIKLNNQTTTSVPKINGIDVLAHAKPIRLNNVQKEGLITKKVEQTTQTIQVQPIQPNIKKEDSRVAHTISQTHQKPTMPNQTMAKKIDSTQINNRQETLARTQTNATQINNTRSTTQMTHTRTNENIEIKRNEPINQDDLMANLALNDMVNDAGANNDDLSKITVDVSQLDFSVTKRVRGYLKRLISIGGSDLHLKAGSQIRARINGDIVIFSDEIFSKDDALTFAKELTRGRFHDLTIDKELDMTYIYDQNARFRVNVFFQMEGVSFAFRTIPTTHGTIEELGLPEALNKIVDMERGLVLVTGITGSGKSTTLAAIINEINQKKAKHIITIEDPIEFVHKDIKSMINQRSVGMDTNSFSKALKAALREDPDIILVGEMRDIETIEMALHAAETGHLVLSTLHTLDAKETINRIISVFPSTDQTRIRMMLSSTLAAIISQRLLKSTNGGRVAAIELLFRTPRIELIINEGRDGEILEALAEGKDIYKTQTFDQHLFELVTSNIVEEEVAMEKATSPSDLKLKLQNVNFSDQQGGDDMISIKS